MKTTIDSAGRIVIPSDIRAEAGLGPGTTVEVGIRHGVISIEPVPSPVKVVKRGRLHVAVAEATGSLSEDDVRAVKEQIRSRS